MSKNEIIINIIVPLVSSLIGGGLTVIGVILSIRHENKMKKKEIQKENKPFLYLINPLQEYDYKSVQQFVFDNKNIKSNGFIEVILKNTDNAIMIMNIVKVDDVDYYPCNGRVVDKNTIICIRVAIDENIENIKKSTIIFSISDVMGNEYKYKLDYCNDDSKYIDVIELIL